MRISDWSSDVCSSDLLAREDRVAERQRGTVAVAEIAHGGEAGAQRLHPVRLGIEGLRGGTERDFLELAGDAARVTRQMDMAVDEAGEDIFVLEIDQRRAGLGRDRKSTRLNSSH